MMAAIARMTTFVDIFGFRLEVASLKGAESDGRPWYPERGPGPETESRVEEECKL